MSHPRTHPRRGPVSMGIGSMFADELDRPLVIVGNGPSSAIPRWDLLPDDPIVFRMNWFFLEDHHYYGRRVDGFFYSIPNAELEARLLTVINEGWYDIRALFSPMRLAAGRDGEHYRSALSSRDIVELDHWSAIAENPTLSRFMMSRPLPTQGVQVLGAALQVGFTDITLCGIDMYESTTARYGYTVPEAVAVALQAKDLAPGYEDAHSLDRDLDFLDACLAQYPEASVKHIGPSRHLSARLPAPEPRPRLCTFGGVPARDVAGSPKPAFRGDPADARIDDGDGLPFAVIEGKRCGFVTLVSGSFHHGARALAHSLAKVSDVPLTVMCTPSADRDALRRSGLVCVDVPEIKNPNRLTGAGKRFGPTYTKLHAFRMPHLDRAVYVDSDMIVLKSIDDLFALEGFWAVPDHGLDFHYDRFNSGLLALDPDPELFERLVAQTREKVSYDQGDQGFLNAVFPDWNRLPAEYNVSKRLSAHHPNLFHLEETRVIHFVGVKPWQPEAPTAYDELYRLWFSFLSDDELLDVAQQLRWQHREPSTPSTRLPPALARLATLRRRRPSADPKPDWSMGTLLRRAQARHRDGAYEAALELLETEWPGDLAASPGLHRERAKSLLLNGRVADGHRALRVAAERFPESVTISRNLRAVDRVMLLRRFSLGLVPDRVLARLAREFAGTT